MEDPVLEKYYKAHSGPVNGASFAVSGASLATAGTDTVLRVWTLAGSKTRSYIYQGHRGPVLGVAYAPDGSSVATCSTDCTVRLWTPGVMKGQSGVFRAHTTTVRSVTFSLDGLNLATCSDDKSIKVWRVANQRFVYSLMGHSNWVKCARFSSDGKLVGSAGDDGSVRLWDLGSRSCIHAFNAHRQRLAVSWVDFHPSGNYLASAGEDASVRVWDLRMRRQGQLYEEHGSAVNAVSFDPSGTYLISGSADKTLKIFDLQEGRIGFTLYGHQSGVKCVEFAKNNDSIVSADEDGQVFLWKSNLNRRDRIGLKNLSEGTGVDLSDGRSTIQTLETGEPVFRATHINPVYDNIESSGSGNMAAGKQRGNPRLPTSLSMSSIDRPPLHQVQKYVGQGKSMLNSSGTLKSDKTAPSAKVVNSASGPKELSNSRVKMTESQLAGAVGQFYEEYSGSMYASHTDENIRGHSASGNYDNHDDLRPAYGHQAGRSHGNYDYLDQFNDNVPFKSSSKNLKSGVGHSPGPVKSHGPTTFPSSAVAPFDLKDTLNEILSQLDMLTQTVSIMDQRLTRVEDKVEVLWTKAGVGSNPSSGTTIPHSSSTLHNFEKSPDFVKKGSSSASTEDRNLHARSSDEPFSSKRSE